MTVATTPLGVPGYTFADLHEPERLASLYDRFCEEASAADPALWREWDAYRQAPDAPRPPIALSNLLIAMAPHVSRFLDRLFDVDAPAAAIAESTRAQDDLFRFKVDFVRRRALPLLKNGAHVAATPEDEAIVEALVAGASTDDCELAIARAGCALLDVEKSEGGRLKSEEKAQAEALKRWCAARAHDRAYRGWVIFRFPEIVEPFHLVEVQQPDPELPEALIGPDWRLRRRDGFTLTDARMQPREVLSEIHYCVLCHERDKDSCSKGLRDKDGKVAVNPLGIALDGCPLEEKISEMHTLRKAGDPVGALALVIVDNPMCPGTGHRICNDCMKSCIFQKQEPVNIPEIETGVLTDVLGLPFGVEIYGLLTRWNPLNVRRPYALPYNGRNVLVVGLGPAGYTLAHYLVNEGFGVVGIDGLKIEPLPADITGTDTTAPRPIRHWSEIYRQLDERVLEGFGGVSEYGITVRWDKNFLTLLHLTLARRRGIRMYGGVRFGGTLPIEDAWAHGFDHVAIAAGAGRPTIIDMKNNLIRGIRKASDFLMALQLTGAFKRNALPNLQARLPAIVIGGGLTAIDTATELMAYYPVQVEKTVRHYETLAAALGEARVRASYDPEELELLDEYLVHGRAVRAERARAAKAGEAPDFVSLVRSWGGVTIAYRKRMVDSPAYRLNHEEVIKALEEGIVFAENLNPIEAVPDANGALRAMTFRREGQAGHEGLRAEGSGLITLPARTALVAAGTSPNITCENEAKGTFQLDAKKKFFQPHKVIEKDGGFHLVPDPDGFFTSHDANGKFVTYYGDNHPRYAGNVVKAMASAKHGFPHVTRLFARELASLDPAGQADRDAAWARLVARLDAELVARVVEVVRLTPTIIEVIVKAPAAARRFHPGQFYRLQNFESVARRARDVPLLMEGIALTGAWVDKERGLLSLIVLELGVSSRLVAHLQGRAGRRDGPDRHADRDSRRAERAAAGRRPRQRRAVLDREGDARARQPRDLLRRLQEGRGPVQARGHRGGHRPGDLEHRHRRPIAPGRPQDAHFRGNIVQAMLAYGRGRARARRSRRCRRCGASSRSDRIA